MNLGSVRLATNHQHEKDDEERVRQYKETNKKFRNTNNDVLVGYLNSQHA
jgi:hypothetical protein